MTPKDAAAGLFAALPKPISINQIQEYGIEVTESQARHIAREILSLNLYWILAAVDAHILQKYRALIGGLLLESVTVQWSSDTFGLEQWDGYRQELDERREYSCAADGRPVEPHRGQRGSRYAVGRPGVVSSDDRQKLPIALNRLCTVDQYAELLDDVR
jgi:hypothetical protein